jgi:uncharacterized delta-60 repeat protein
MKKIFFVLLLVTGFQPDFVLSQNTAPTWTSVFKGPGDNSDRFNKVISDGFGNFIGVGYTVKQENYRDILAVKFNANGDTLWWRTKNGKASGDDEAIAVGVDASGNVFVAGYQDNDQRQNDIVVIKFDSVGTVLWDTTWDSPVSLDDVPADLKIDGSGNCFVGGSAEPDTVPGSSDYITIKYDPTGAILWSRQYSRPGVTYGKDELAAITLDAGGHVYVTGRSLNTLGDEDFITIKYDGSVGTELWVQTYNGGNDDMAKAIIKDNLGNIIVTGSSDNGNNNDIRTIKYTSGGSLRWTRSYNAPANQEDNPRAIAVDANDNVIVASESDIDLSPSSNFDFQTIKYDSAGTLQWAIRTGNVVPQDDQPNSVAVDGSGNIFVTGKSDQNITPGVANNDFMTVMYNSSGSIQWSGPVYHSGTRPGDDDVASCVITDGLGNIYVVGGAVDTIGQKNATVIKYAISSGNKLMERNYNGKGDFTESAKSIVLDANNNSYVAGYTFMENKNLDACIVKTDPSGAVLCSYIYNGFKNDDDEFYTIAIGLNGNIYAAGYTRVIDQKRNMLLVKWDAATCDTVWTRTYDYIGQSDRAESIVLDVTGNIYLTGRSDAHPGDTTDNNDIVTMKYDANGNVLWSQRFNGTGNLKDEPAKIILDNNGDVIVAGRSENVHDDDFVVLKYNAITGVPVWANPAIYGGPFANDDRVTDVLVDANNNIFVCGYSQTSSGNATQDPVIIKFDSAGVYAAGFFTVGDDKDEPVKMAIDINSNLYVVFKFDADGGVQLMNNYDYLTRKFDNNLVELWSTPPQYDSPVDGDDLPADIFISPSGDVFVTGSSENDTSGGRVNKNWVTVGYDVNGIQIFSSNFDGPNATDDSPNAMIIRGSCMWVTGYSEDSLNSQKDITTNYYCPIPVNINELQGVYSSAAYPNPFSKECKIIINDYIAKSTLKLELFDILGSRVVTPVEFYGNTVDIQRGNLAPGIYQYRVVSENALITFGKLVIN